MYQTTERRAFSAVELKDISLFCFSFMKKLDYQGTDTNSSWREYSLSHLVSYYYSSSAIGFVNLFLFSTRKNRPSTKSQS